MGFRIITQPANNMYWASSTPVLVPHTPSDIMIYTYITCWDGVKGPTLSILTFFTIGIFTTHLVCHYMVSPLNINISALWHTVEKATYFFHSFSQNLWKKKSYHIKSKAYGGTVWSHRMSQIHTTQIHNSAMCIGAFTYAKCHHLVLCSQLPCGKTARV